MSEKERKLISAVQELVETERTYVIGLQTLSKYFYNPIRYTPKSLLLRKSTKNDMEKSNERILTNEETNHIFSNVSTLLPFHEELLRLLEERLAVSASDDTSSRLDLKVGDIFLERAPFLKMYTIYLNNYQNAMTVLKRCQETNADFKVSQFIYHILFYYIDFFFFN